MLGDAGGMLGDAGGMLGDAGGCWGMLGGCWGDAGGMLGGCWGDAGGCWGDAGGMLGGKRWKVETRALVRHSLPAAWVWGQWPESCASPAVVVQFGIVMTANSYVIFYCVAKFREFLPKNSGNLIK